MNNKPMHFPNITSLRFFAAFLVIFSHIEQFKGKFHLPNLHKHPIINQIGSAGVFLFFTLSGFLITFLLLEEETTTGKISLKKFYMRRILRIWPLYLFIILVGFFVLPHFSWFYVPGWSDALETNFWQKFSLFIFFFSNVALFTYPPVSSISQSWSVSSEEQFYLFWPILVKNKKNIIKTLFAFFFFIIALKLFLKFGSRFYPIELKFFSKYLKYFPIESMTWGGILAAIYRQKHSLYLIFTHRRVEILSLVLSVLVVIFLGYFPDVFRPLIASIPFGILIANLATVKKPILKLENKFLIYLGKISYGLYMYHPLIIPPVIYWGLQIGNTSSIFLFLITFLLTIGISALSYHFLELPFLKIKSKFTLVNSRTD